MSKSSRFRSQFDYDTEAASNDATVKDNGESMTVQSQSEDADINVMMKRFGVGMKMPDNPNPPTYGDFTGISDYRSALEALREADDSFMEFTPEVRERFSNDPQRLMEFLDKAENFDEAKRLGLLREDAKRPSAAPGAPAGAAGAPGAPGTPVP